MMSDIVNIRDFYSAESRITIVENAIINIDKRFDRMENDLKDIKLELRDTKQELKGDIKEVKGDIKELKSNVRGNLFWTLGCILGIYGSAFVTLISAVGKAYHWF
jgi:hypothetical protein